LAKHVSENNYTITFNINNDLGILNIQNNIDMNSILDDSHIYKEVWNNKLIKILCQLILNYIL